MEISVTLKFDSKEEFDNTRIITGDEANPNSEIVTKLNELGEKVDAVYHAGQDDVGGEFVKDVKDLDDVAEGEYDEALYQHAKALFELYRDNKYGSAKIARSKIRDLIGEYSVEPGLSDEMYAIVIGEFRSLCRRAEIWKYQNIDEKFASSN